LTATSVRNDLWREQCPVCGNAVIDQIGKVPVSGDVEYSTHSVVLERVPEIWKCHACGSWFTQNAVPEATALALYASGNSGTRWLAEPFETAKNIELVGEFDRHIGAQTKILDIGCSTGQLLDYAKKRGAVTFGVDFSEACRTIVTEKGHRFAVSLSEFSSERFDVITAFDVVEHLYDFSLFLANVVQILKPGGKLVVLTGDIRSLGARYCGSRWWYLRYPEHIVFPSRDYFKGLVRGLHLERMVRTYASVGYRVAFLPALRTALLLARRGNYNGLPSLGPDHMLVVLRRD